VVVVKRQSKSIIFRIPRNAKTGGCGLIKTSVSVLALAEKYEELKLLHDLLGKGIITQEEFDDKKGGTFRLRFYA